MAEYNERTFIMIKPDGVQRGLVGDIIKRFEQKGFKLVAMKFMQVRECRIEHKQITLMTLYKVNVYCITIFYWLTNNYTIILGI